MASYPAAYKSAAKAYGAGLSKVPAIPAPLKKLPGLPKFPIPANLNFVQSRGASAVLPKLLGKAFGVLAVADLAWDIYKLVSFGKAGADLNGWTKQSTCVGGTPFYYSIGASTNYACGGSQFSTGLRTMPVKASDITPTSNWMKTFARGSFIVDNVYNAIPSGVYSRPASATINVPRFWPGTYVEPVPVLNPWVNPMELPILKPVPTPLPAPLTPGKAPEVFPDAQPSEEPAPKRNPSPNPRPEVFPLPEWPAGSPVPAILTPPAIEIGTGPIPVVAPGVEILLPTTGSPTVTQPPGGPPTNRPPGPKGKKARPDKGTKERKINVKSAVPTALNVAINFATESLDFVDSLYAGVPAYAKKCPPHDYNCKGKTIWHHLDEIDAAAAVVAFVNNQYEDAVFGVLGQNAGAASGQMGVTTGLGKAANFGGKLARDLDPEAGGPLPELTYDPKTGEFGVAWSILG